jgi:hypothetical protein
VTANPKGSPIPDLATDKADDAFVSSAMGHLLQTRGDSAVQRFIELTARLEPFDGAFSSAFGVTPEQYQAEYEQAVNQARR